MKTSKSRAVKSSALLCALSLTVAVIAIFAFLSTYSWFAVRQYADTKGVNVSIIDISHGGYIITNLNSERVTERALTIYPDTKLNIVVEAIVENDNIGIKIAIEPLEYNQFYNYFSKRNDLLLGQYQKADNFNNGADQIYYDFDIDYHLLNYRKPLGNGLTPVETLNSKVDFLHRFTKQNSMHDTLTVKVVNIESSVVPQLTEPVEFFKYEGDDEEYAEVYFPHEPLFIPKYARIEIEIIYGNGYLPVAMFEEDDAEESAKPFYDGYMSGKTHYSAFGYNCFIGQNMFISFINMNPDPAP